jgi:hypothetical protein
MKSKAEKYLKGTVILFTEAIGEAIIALPALRAMQTELKNTSVFVVTSTFIGELLKDDFPDWHFRTPDQTRDVTYCETLIDTRCMGWSIDWITSVCCDYKIGADIQDDLHPIYHHLVRSGPFKDTTSACELFNCFARFLNPDVSIDAVPKLTMPLSSPDKKRIGLVPGAGCNAKRWPKTNFRLVEDWASANQIETVWFLGPKEVGLEKDLEIQTCKLRGSLEASKLLQELGSCNVVVSNDTALMHLSAAIGVATLGIFGPSLPGQWFPYHPPSKYFQHDNAGSEKGIIIEPDERYAFWPESSELIVELENLITN